ncbi:MAG: hypothetical protein P1U37_10955 [Minwuia sp.]|nr:hypothetical protein [Minwuia sp.]
MIALDARKFMRTAVFAASHMLAALGVAVLALSSPTEAHGKMMATPPAAHDAAHLSRPDRLTGLVGILEEEGETQCTDA